VITGTFGGTKEKETTFVRLWNAETGVPLGMPMEHPKLVRHVAFSHDDTRIATGCFDGGVRLWDGVTCALIGTAFSRDGAGAPKLSGPVRSVEFSSDGKRLVVVIGSKTEIWDAVTLKLERTIGHWLQPSVHLAPDISSDGTRLVTAGEGKAQVWDLHSGTPIGEPMWCQYNTVTGAVKFSPDGLIVVTAMECQARIWDAQTGVELREPFYHHPQINELAFSPDGTRLLTSGADQTIRIWDIAPLPRPKDVPEWIRAFTLLTLRRLEERPRSTPIAPPVAKSQASVPFREREAKWYTAVGQRQAKNCRQFQLSAAREAEAMKNWFAAEFHLRHLSLAEPGNVQFRNRLQIARQNLKLEQNSQ
jgi:hypothetical protein